MHPPLPVRAGGAEADLGSSSSSRVAGRSPTALPLCAQPSHRPASGRHIDSGRFRDKGSHASARDHALVRLCNPRSAPANVTRGQPRELEEGVRLTV
jgi:hypothetical protein